MYKNTEIWIPSKRSWTYMVYAFWDTWSTSALKYHGVDLFGRIRTKIYKKTRDPIGKEILVCFIKLVSICTRSQHRVFSLPCWPWVWMEWFREACTTSRSDNFQPVRLCFVTYRMKLDEVDFVDEEFLPKKINNREDFTDYGVAVDISEDTSS